MLLGRQTQALKTFYQPTFLQAELVVRVRGHSMHTAIAVTAVLAQHRQTVG